MLLLAAGYGKRLMPYTKLWPKCLMPINGRPLLEYWFHKVKKTGFKKIFLNTHYKKEILRKFIKQAKFSKFVFELYEKELLGTAGTILKNIDLFENKRLLLIHADNWCTCNLEDFINYHLYLRPQNTYITMMTFKSDNPSDCGIVDTNKKGIVRKFFEKPNIPPHNLANGAVYCLEPEVLKWLKKNDHISDFSTEVIPKFIGKIATWENKNTHRDIGLIQNLIKSQNDFVEKINWVSDHKWDIYFKNHQINKMIKELLEKR